MHPELKTSVGSELYNDFRTCCAFLFEIEITTTREVSFNRLSTLLIEKDS